jgi:hypothetical protein
MKSLVAKSININTKETMKRNINQRSTIRKVKKDTNDEYPKKLQIYVQFFYSNSLSY